MPEVRPATPDEGKALTPELSRSVSALARALVAAARNSALYPPEHPAVPTSVERLRTVLAREDQPLVNTWEPDARGDVPHAVVEAVDPESVRLDPLSYL
jgi:hypothetical protein